MRHLDVGVPVLSLRGQRAPLLLGVPYEWMCPCPAAAAASARHEGRLDHRGPEKTCPSPDDDEKEDDHEVEVVVKSHR